MEKVRPSSEKRGQLVRLWHSGRRMAVLKAGKAVTVP